MALKFVILMLAAVSRSSPTDARESRVCSTLEPDNCTNVHYKDTELILTCSECNFECVNPIWTKDDCNTTKNIFARGQNITINPDQRRLTNDDSGTYCCTCGRHQYQVQVNILAPPKLTNPPNCKCSGVDNNICDAGGRSFYNSDSGIDISVNFTGNGPFTVGWKLNNTDFDCDNHSDVCASVENTKNSQTLRFKHFDIEDGWKISGNYSAIVSNHYGKNESILRVYYICDISRLKTIDNGVNITVIEGTPFNNSCLIASKNADVLATKVCVTRNVSATFEDLANSGTCAVCIYNEDGCKQLNSSITTINVFRYEERQSYCSPYQHTKFWSNSASLKDNGTIIWCGYDNAGPRGYSSFHVTVQPRLPNPPKPYHNEVSLPLLISGVVIAIVAVIVIAIVVVNAIIGIRLYRQRKLHSTGRVHSTSSESRNYVANDSETEQESSESTPLLHESPSTYHSTEQQQLVESSCADICELQFDGPSEHV